MSEIPVPPEVPDLDLQEKREDKLRIVVILALITISGILWWLGFISPVLPDSFEFTVNTTTRGPVTFYCIDPEEDKHYVCTDQKESP